MSTSDPPRPLHGPHAIDLHCACGARWQGKGLPLYAVEMFLRVATEHLATCPTARKREKVAPDAG